jgi:hypothetical protein
MPNETSTTTADLTVFRIKIHEHINSVSCVNPLQNYYVPEAAPRSRTLPFGSGRRLGISELGQVPDCSLALLTELPLECHTTVLQ